MEHRLGTRLPKLLNYVLICQEFASLPTLRLYLESKGCTVVQQDDTVVGIGSVPSLLAPKEPRLGDSLPPGFSASRDADIHAYLRAPGNWKPEWMPSPRQHINGISRISSASARQTEDREEHVCIAFVKAANTVDMQPHADYHFFDEALSHVRSAYARHERYVAASHLSESPEETRTRESIHLTMREHEILKWVSEGKGCWETGAILGISERTVKFHLQNIYRKLNVVNRAQAITKAMRYSLI